MAETTSPAHSAPPRLQSTTRLFARALGWTPDELQSRFRKAGIEDEAALLDFRARSGWDDRAYVRWRFGTAGGQGGRFGAMWILRHGDGPVLAAIGTEMQPIRHVGQIHRGQLVMDVQLDPALEGAGGGVWLNQTMFLQADATLAIGGNAHSMGLVKRMFAPLPPRRYHALPLRAAASLTRRGVPALLAAAAGPAFDAGWGLRARWRAPPASGLRVEEVHKVDDAWLRPLHDALDPATACIAPDPRHLHWRLRDNPRARYRLFIALRGERCVGYAAARVVVEADGTTGMHVQDWKLAADESDGAFSVLLAQLRTLAHKEACSRIFTTCLAPATEALFARLGFLPGKTAPHLLTGIHTDLPLPCEPYTSQWQITDLSFDGDGGY